MTRMVELWVLFCCGFYFDANISTLCNQYLDEQVMHPENAYTVG